MHVQVPVHVLMYMYRYLYVYMDIRTCLKISTLGLETVILICYK